MSELTSYSVLVMDLFHFMDKKEEALETGFPTWEAARCYARARTWSSVQEHRKEGLSADEVKRLWMAFGESAIVIGGPHYSAKDDIEYFLEHEPSPEETDYSKIARIGDTQPPCPEADQQNALLQPALLSVKPTPRPGPKLSSIRIQPVGAWALTGLIV